jgi:dCMP deaminase
MIPERDRDLYWLRRCAADSVKSDDPRTQVGCVIVGADGEMQSEGWNSLAQSVRRIPSRLQSPDKYLWIEHAERNAIYSAARRGVALKGNVIYVQLMPCADCARAIIQAGITEVVLSADASDAYDNPHYREHHAAAAAMFSEAGVTLRQVKLEG